ncbi:MAG: hypothetical protein JXB30_05495 [Anaerolineae bacterium]|nr:hypothetical protein [Anaerolineae bacterium]
MQDQPNSNPTTPQKDTAASSSVGGDHIVITGNVGPGVNIGRGSATFQNIAGNDLITNNGVIADGQTQFTELLDDLKEMILQAKEKGELDGVLAKQAVEQLETAGEMVKKEKKAAKPLLIKKLEAVAELIEAAVEVFTAGDGGVATVLVKALPIAYMLVKLAARIF